MDLNRYSLQLSYKGTDFYGWQKQSSKRTVQGEIESCLTKLNSNKIINISGCGRTDTGVHAKKYIAHFDFKKNIDLEVFKKKINQLLPKDISVEQVKEENSSFHARYDAKLRTYNYYINIKKNPFLEDVSLYYPFYVDVEKLNKACEILKMNEDFECFSKVRTQVKTFNCKIIEAKWIVTKYGVKFEITANRFLRNMVRSIVGTMMLLNENKINLDDFDQIIKSKDRRKAGKSVKSNGLFLINVEY